MWLGPYSPLDTEFGKGHRVRSWVLTVVWCGSLFSIALGSMVQASPWLPYVSLVVWLFMVSFIELSGHFRFRGWVFTYVPGLLSVAIVSVLLLYSGGTRSVLWGMLIIAPLFGLIRRDPPEVLSSFVSLMVLPLLFFFAAEDGSTSLGREPLGSLVSREWLIFGSLALVYSLVTSLRESKKESQVRSSHRQEIGDMEEMILQNLTVRNSRMEAVLAAADRIIVVFDGNGKLTLSANLDRVFPEMPDPISSELTLREFRARLRQVGDVGPVLRILGGHNDGPIRWSMEEKNRRVFEVTGRDTTTHERLIILTDITSRVADETIRERTSRSEKLAALGSLAGGVAHDFNNILQVIMGAIGEAIYDLSSEQKGVQSVLEEAIEATSRGAELAQQMMVFSEVRESSASSFDTGELMHVMARMLSRAIGDAHTIDVQAEEGCMVHSVDSEIRRVLLNFLLNARDAMPGGGCLYLRTEKRHLEAGSQLLGPVQEPGWYVLMSVADTGTGMPEEVQRRLFEPFFTTKGVAGTGLGLATSYAIARNWGGRIHCHSRLGVGTTMTLLLPLSTGEDVEVADAVAYESEGIRGKIVVVEDDVTVRRTLARSLTRAGFTIQVFENGNEALEALVETEPRPNFELLLTDINMPGVSGIELAERLKSRDVACSVLFLTGYGSAAPEVGLMVPEGQTISKPIRIQQLVARLEQALVEHRLNG